MFGSYHVTKSSGGELKALSTYGGLNYICKIPLRTPTSIRVCTLGGIKVGRFDHARDKGHLIKVSA